MSEGESLVGFVNHYYLFRFLVERGEAFPVRNYYFEPGDSGSIILVSAIGIMETSQNKTDAKRFIEFMLSEEAQQYFATKTFEYPMVEGIQTHDLIVPLSQIEVPSVDLAELADLQITLNLLIETGLIP